MLVIPSFLADCTTPVGEAIFWLQAQVALLLDGMAVFDRTIKVSMARGGAGPGVVRSNDPDRVQRTVHVGGLPMEELSETVLADFFQNVGEVNEAPVHMASWTQRNIISSQLLQYLVFDPISLAAGSCCQKEWSLCLGGVHFHSSGAPGAHIGWRTAWLKHVENLAV